MPYTTIEHLIELATRADAVVSNEASIGGSSVVAHVLRTERRGEPNGGRDSISIIGNHEKECTFHPNPWLRNYIPKVVGLEILLYEKESTLFY